jgi:hypothetical protein
MWRKNFIPEFNPFEPAVQTDMFDQLEDSFKADFPDLWHVFHVAVAHSKSNAQKNKTRSHLFIYALSILANVLCPEARGIQTVVGMMLLGAGAKADAFQVLNRMHLTGSRATMKEDLAKLAAQQKKFFEDHLSPMVVAKDNVDKNLHRRNATSDAGRTISSHTTCEAVVLPSQPTPEPPLREPKDALHLFAPQRSANDGRDYEAFLVSEEDEKLLAKEEAIAIADLLELNCTCDKPIISKKKVESEPLVAPPSPVPPEAPPRSFFLPRGLSHHALSNAQNCAEGMGETLEELGINSKTYFDPYDGLPPELNCHFPPPAMATNSSQRSTEPRSRKVSPALCAPS